MILQALAAFYDRVAAADAEGIAPPNFSYESISFAIVLNRDGDVVAINDLRLTDTKGKFKPQRLLVPQLLKRSGRKPPPCFLWDKTSFALGVKATDPNAVENGANPYSETPDNFRRFKEAHAVLAASEDAGLLALGRFVRSWRPSSYAALDHAASMIDKNVVFRLDGNHQFVHQSSAASALWRDAHASQSEEPEIGVCLVTGKTRPLARVHPSIKGVRGAQQSGGSIVSFNLKAFTSYGREQSFNAPISQEAAFAYTTALNTLLLRGDRNVVVIGDTTIVFWAEADNLAETRAAEEWAATLFHSASAQLSASLRAEFIEKNESAPSLKSAVLELNPRTRFFILGLAPNQARLSVRIWEETTLGDLSSTFQQHFSDISLVSSPRLDVPPSLWSLTLCAAPSRRDEFGNRNYASDDIPKLLSAELLRAIFNRKRPYPATLLTTLTMRIRRDAHIDRLRASLLKGCLVRRMRLQGRLPNRECLMNSDFTEDCVPRRLGRLFAVLERAQACALGGQIYGSIKDKYLGAAAATPSRIFVRIYKNSLLHTKRLRNGHSDAKWIKDASSARRTGYALERDIGLLWQSFDDGLPTHQSVEDQALFFLGYFQERYGARADTEIGAQQNIDNLEKTAENAERTEE